MPEQISDPADFIAGVPPELSACIRTCGKRNYRERYQSAQEASRSLDTIAVIDSREKTTVTGQNMSSLYLFYNDEQKSQVTSLLEEFSERLKAEDIRFRLADFDNFLN